MKRLPAVGFALLVALSVTACSKKSPADPSAPAAPKFTAQLSPLNENPPITNADQSGSGTMTLTLNVTRDAAQQITAATGDFTVTLSGFPAGTTLTGAHIHLGRPGINGSIVVPLAVAAAEFVLANGSVTFTKNATSIGAVVAQNMINDPVGFYFNVHTTISGGGAVRGQLVIQ